MIGETEAVAVNNKKREKDIVCEEFHRLCLEDLVISENDGDGIGTYSEKRFPDADCYEVKVGNYVADVLCDGHITEIQTTAYAKLAPKIRYYLENTDYTVSVVMPLISALSISSCTRFSLSFIRPRMLRLPDLLTETSSKKFMDGEPTNSAQKRLAG